MSTSELERSAPPMVRRGSTRLLRSELQLVFRRRRNLALLAVLACFPVLLGIAVRSSTPGPNSDGPAFLGQITQNGLFLGFTSLVVTLPLFLPLAVSVASGESIAGEAATGTLRNLLVVPVGRTRVLRVKFGALVAFAVVCALLVATVGIVVGFVLFPTGPVTLLSGSTISLGAALFRALLVALYVAAMLVTVAAIGLFVSTMTEVPMGAMAATAILTVICEIVDSVPQVSAVHPYLFSHWWLTFGDLLRSPVQTGDMVRGLLTQAVYVVVFCTAAWARLGTKDVTS
jgi:ABC-2 type transport system permease protein